MDTTTFQQSWRAATNLTNAKIHRYDYAKANITDTIYLTNVQTVSMVIGLTEIGNATIIPKTCIRKGLMNLEIL